MKTYLLNGASVPSVSLEGEANAVRVGVRCDAWAEQFPQGAGVLLFRRPDGEVYPLTAVHEPPYLYAVLSGAETAVPGLCRIEAQWRVGSGAEETVIAKSGPYRLRIVSSLSGAGLPSPAPTWADRVLESAAAVERTAESIPEDYSALSARVRENEVIRYTDPLQLRYKVGYYLNTTAGENYGKEAANARYVLMPDYIFAKAGSTVGLTSYTDFQFQVARYELEDGAYVCKAVKSASAASQFTMPDDGYLRFSVRTAEGENQTDDSLKQYVLLDIRSEKANTKLAGLTISDRQQTEDIASIKAKVIDGSDYVRGYGIAVNGSNYAQHLTDLNAALPNRVYYLNQCLQYTANRPGGDSSVSGMLLTLAPYRTDNQSCLQLLHTEAGQLWVRRQRIGEWGGWTPLMNREASADAYLRGIDERIDGNNWQTKLTDLNDAQINRVYFLNSCLQSVANKPDGETAGSGILLTLAAYKNSGSQTQRQVLFAGSGDVWHRACWTGTWSGWVQLLTEQEENVYVRGMGRANAVDGNNWQTKLPDLDGAQVNRTYYLNTCLQSLANKPAEEPGASGLLVTLAAHRNSDSQTCVQHLYGSSGYIWKRARWKGAWEAWELENDDRYDSKKYCLSTCVDKLAAKLGSGDKFVVFGDSIATMSWVTRFAAATGTTAVRKAVGGAAFGRTEDNKKIITQVNAMTASDWAGAKVVFVAAGTNDASWNIAPETVKEKVPEVITAIRAATDAHIVFITPIRRGDAVGPQRRLTTIAGVIGHAAAVNGCSVINGFDFPIPAANVGAYGSDSGTLYLIDDLTQPGQTSDHDGVHPGAAGQQIYARSVINAIM